MTDDDLIMKAVKLKTLRTNNQPDQSGLLEYMQLVLLQEIAYQLKELVRLKESYGT